MRTILFICTGNTCRSPMAEAIARQAIDRGQVPGAGDVFVASAGVQALRGQPISEETLAALKERGIDHDGTATRLTAEMIRRATVVLGMSEEHLAAARALVASEPQEQAKIQRLDPQGEIEDPIGMGQSAYHHLAARLEGVLPRRLSEVLAADPLPPR